MKKYYFVPILIIVSYLIPCISVQAIVGSRQDYEKTGYVIWEVKTDKKIVSITFDDGPHPVYTPQILDILAKHHAKSTFFVSGNKAALFPEVLKRTMKEGHEIANHTYHHIYNPNMNASKLKMELDQTSSLIKRITGVYPSLYRPVGGYYNNLIINTAVQNGYLIIMWSWHQDPKDWSNPGANKITEHVISAVQPGDVIILHDSGGNRSQTVRALKNILELLDKNGYRCVTISELLFESDKNNEEFFRFFPIK